MCVPCKERGSWCEESGLGEDPRGHWNSGRIPEGHRGQGRISVGASGLGKDPGWNVESRGGFRWERQV